RALPSLVPSHPAQHVLQLPAQGEAPARALAVLALAGGRVRLGDRRRRRRAGRGAERGGARGRLLARLRAGLGKGPGDADAASLPGALLRGDRARARDPGRHGHVASVPRARAPARRARWGFHGAARRGGAMSTPEPTRDQLLAMAYVDGEL